MPTRVRAGTERPSLAVLALAGLLAAAASPAAAQEGEAPRDLTISSDALEIGLGGRLQLQTVTGPCSDFPFDADSPCAEQAPAVDMLVRRARLSVEIEISELVDAKIQPEFGSLDQVQLKDAWGRLSLDPALRVKLGHFKRPFDGFQLTSSTRILTIERDLDVPGVPGLAAASLDEFTTRFRVSDRDVGVMAHGEPGGSGFAYWLGVFNGRGLADERDVNSGKQIVGRARYMLQLDGSLPLALAAAAASTDLPFQGPGDQPGVPASGERYGNYELWAELGGFRPGPHVQAGVLLGENPLRAEGGGSVAPAPGTEPPELAAAAAWQVVGSYRLPVEGTDVISAVEPVFRITRADPDTGLGDDEVSGFTPGVQIFFSGRNKIALNWDLVDFAGDGPGSVSSFKAQFQAHF